MKFLWFLESQLKELKCVIRKRANRRSAMFNNQVDNDHLKRLRQALRKETGVDWGPLEKTGAIAYDFDSKADYRELRLSINEYKRLRAMLLMYQIERREQKQRRIKQRKNFQTSWGQYPAGLHGGRV